jgi:hypothetical protein
MEVINKIKDPQEKILSEEDLFFEFTSLHVENLENYFLMQKNFRMKLSLISGINSKFLEEIENDIIDLKKWFLQLYLRNEEKLKAVIRK